MNKPSQTNKPKVVLLTGGIGAGKSTVGAVFRALGVPVYDADVAAKEILATKPNVLAAVVEIFGREAYLADGLPNSAFIANRIFHDDNYRTKLNAIVHPAVAHDFSEWMRRHEDVPYCIKESAIAIDVGALKDTDHVILVVAPEKLRIERVMKRNSISAQDVKARIDAQWSDEQKLPFADYVVQNDGANAIIPQVLRLHDLLKSKD